MHTAGQFGGGGTDRSFAGNVNIQGVENFFHRFSGIPFLEYVKLDLNGIRFFWDHELKKECDWVKIVKPPKVRSIQDILTVDEVYEIIC
jgi:integrase/recombinase XerD